MSSYKSSMGVDGRPRALSHSGVDFIAEEGSAVLAVNHGRIVSYVDSPTGVGKCLLVRHTCQACATRVYFTSYCHLRSVVGIPGGFVKRGERIGDAGNTGSYSMGIPHVHLTVCIFPCVAAAADGQFDGILDPMMFDVGCFESRTTYSDTNHGQPIHTHPIPCSGK
ncbi:MAG: M23 family metallopeptidase [Gemmatimonadaceae bacterium]|nr:M23 family metallopeptidase [Gemmatimonadaceae bacterium]